MPYNRRYNFTFEPEIMSILLLFILAALLIALIIHQEIAFKMVPLDYIIQINVTTGNLSKHFLNISEI